MTRNFDDYWLRRARLNATMSTCHRRHVGAVAVRERRSFADGFNGNLPGATHCDDGGCGRCDDYSRGSGVDLDQCVCVHAEMNIICWCAATGTPLGGSTVYSTTHPCLDCTKALIMAGVGEVVYDEEYPSVSVMSSRITMRRFACD